MFPTFRELLNSNGKRQGTVQVSVIDADSFARRVADVTGLEAAVSIGGRITGATIPGIEPGSLPQTEGIANALGEPMRAASYESPGFGGQLGRVTVMEPESIVAVIAARAGC